MHRFLFALLALSPLCASAQNPPSPNSVAPTKSQADIDHDAAWEHWRTPLPEGLTVKDREFWTLRDPNMQKFVEAVRAFAEKYPNDPRRYNGWVQSSFTAPTFVTGFKPEFDAKPNADNLIVDTAKRDKFRAEQDVLLSKVVLAEDASVRQRGGAIFALLAEARGIARESGKAVDYSKIQATVERALTTLQDERVLPVVETFAEALRRESPEKADAFEATLQSMPKIATALAEAKEKRAADEAAAEKKLRDGAADLKNVKFTAADGREVDFSKLKGKVVLVDFWATWCGPCIAEIPNIKSVYSKYHAKGFEIVGITLENPKLSPKDTPAQTAAKLDAAKKTMLEFAEKNQMTWPQYFDGRGWKNQYVEKYGIQGIPAMFLLDQEGNVVTTEARGEKLEAEVKRLLGV